MLVYFKNKPGDNRYLKGMYLFNENTIQVEYYNKKVNIPLQKSISECSNNIIARYIMNGFARLYMQ